MQSENIIFRKKLSTLKIVVTGQTGYIATKLGEHFNDTSNEWECTLISIRNNAVNTINLVGVDVLIHTAAIVHKKESSINTNLYKEINTDLTYKLAMRAKNAGVKHFIFISTMAVYGVAEGEISEKTIEKPVSEYGKSKFDAENLLLGLEDSSFKVAIVRPPMVYGPNCPGNYASLRKLSRITPVFPKVENARSMIFIGNLINFIEQIIIYEDAGIFHPQDPQYINTANMVREIASIHNKKIYSSRLGAKILKVLLGRTKIYNKVFGNLYYQQNLSSYRDNKYQIYNVKQAINILEKEIIHRDNETII